MPPYTQPGDLVCVIWGATTPYLLCLTDTEPLKGAAKFQRSCLQTCCKCCRRHGCKFGKLCGRRDCFFVPHCRSVSKRALLLRNISQSCDWPCCKYHRDPAIFLVGESLMLVERSIMSAFEADAPDLPFLFQSCKFGCIWLEFSEDEGVKRIHIVQVIVSVSVAREWFLRAKHCAHLIISFRRESRLLVKICLCRL